MRTLRTRAAPPACVATAAAALSVLFLLTGGGTWQVITCWLAVASLATGMTLYAYRATRLMDRTDSERRFWLAFAVAGVVFSLGDYAQVATSIVDASSAVALTGTGVARTVALGLGGLILTLVVLTYPLPHRTVRERVCYLLDLATVVTAGGVFGAYWTVSSTWHPGEFARVAAGPVVAMLTAFAVGRLFLSGAAPFRWHIGLIGPAAAAVEAVSRALGPQLANSGRSGWIFTMTVSSHAALLIAAWLQHRRWVSGRHAFPPVRRRPYSLMPYVALAATFLLLVLTLVLNGLDIRAWVILTGAVASTAIVVARQIAAFVDNSQLLRERDELTAELHEMAFTDSLTGLANRPQFLERLGSALRGGERRTTAAGEVGVLLIDLDDFKPVNDRFGHAAGDAVLVETADRLRATVRPGDVVARLGGDEFAVLPEQTPGDGFADGGFADLAERIVRAIAAPYLLDNGHQVWVGACVGVAVADDGDASALLIRADEAMYAAKSGGKGGFQVSIPVPADNAGERTSPSRC